LKRVAISFCLFLLVSAGAAKAALTGKDCAECHSGQMKEVPAVDRAVLEKSIHGSLDCVDCHQSITEIPHPAKPAPVDCGVCHEDAARAYKKHGRLKVGTDPDIPTCANCHGTHDTLSVHDKKSRVHPLNLPETCGSCHENLNLVEKHAILLANPVETYKSSVHGQATSLGTYSAATCNDCHSSGGTAHRILAPGDPESTINHFMIPRTCGKCHQSVEKDYWEGIHGQLTERGETDSPVCTHCHGEHGILPPDDPRSPVSPIQIAEATCAPCHESAALNEKYGIPAGRLASFVDSYHGLKSKAGDITVANCASCHGAHRILPHTDPSSSIYPANLRTTCGRCHPKISAELAKTKIHARGGLHHIGWSRFFAIFYIVVIAVTLSGMILYILLDIWRYLRGMLGRAQVPRLTRWEVTQHALLTVSFVVLVITGFALRFYDSWWANLLFGKVGGFRERSLIHRVAAVVLIATSFAHILYLRTQRGRRILRDIFPSWKDFQDLLHMIRFNLGLSPERPAFARFSYIEKFEYWALVWGVAIMTVTGLMLWFDNFMVQFLPKGVLDVMSVIHYYEAWLATLAIVIWHFYGTIYSPGVYPMNPSWITGKMPKDQYEHEHAGESGARPGGREK
jgi:cytochrome b subunit of formate dehydrogenase